MKFLDLKYIGLYKYLNITATIMLLLMFSILGIPVNALTIIGTVLFVLNVSSKYNFQGNIALKELRRRIYQLPVTRDTELIWKRKGNIGIFFIDRQSDVFWYCGTQTSFEAIALPLNEVDIQNFTDRITIEHSSWGTYITAFKN